MITDSNQDSIQDVKNPGPEESKQEMDSYCKQHGFVTWFELPSRKTDGYKQVYGKAVDRILEEVISLSREGLTIWGDWKLKYGT